MSDRGWKRYGVEGVVIVGSILLALFVDAVWEYRLDRVAEREYLESLASEFRASGHELASDQEARRATLAGVDGLLRLSSARPETDASDDSIGAWLASALDYRFYSPVRSVLDDLISAGNLGLIRSEEIRFALLDYVQEMDRLQVAEERERDFVADQLEPYLAARIRIPDYVTLPPGAPGPRATEAAPGPDLRAVLTDPQFASLLAVRRERAQTSTAFAGEVGRAIQRIQERIDSTLTED